MRVLHATGAFLPTKGGGPYFVHHLTSALKRDGHDCLVVAPDLGGVQDTETVPTTRPTGLKVGPLPFSPTFPVALARAVKRFDPDVIHTHYPLPFYPEATAVISNLYETPMTITCHGAFEMDLKTTVGVFGLVYNRSLLRVPLRAAKTIHVSNEHILDELTIYDRYRAKTRTIPMGVDTDWYDPSAVGGKPPFTASSPTVLFVGSFRRYKGLGYLVDAFATVLMHTDASLVLLGDGPRKDVLQDKVRELGISGSVEFVGHVDDEELRRAYASADVFVLPSPSIAESLGLVALEAMAMGVPTIVTGGSGVGRLLKEEEAGTVVKPASTEALVDALVALLNDTDKRRIAGCTARSLITERYDWSALVKEYESLYRSTLE